jgi:ComF family protein
MQLLKNELKNVGKTAISIVYPQRCPVCDGVVGIFAGDRLIHEECRKKIGFITGNTCMKCGKPLSGKDSELEYCLDCRRMNHVFDRGFGAFEYRSISGSIYRFKYMGRQEYAEFYAREIASRYGKRIKRLGVEAIVPVPMFREKERKRGYNQAEVLAAGLSEKLGIPLEKNLIKRTVDTLPMKQLDARGRRINLKKAFNISRNDVKFKCILIIDDIYTTGSTIDEIAHEFRIAGVQRIYFLTLAIGQTT